ncbi:MAG: NUDIX hydrolase [Clostridiales bacterium]|nr:NUDIX hydrolase [Clostridiales bacterium]
MRQEISAGGVVMFGNAILMLEKFNGEWVLPKGKVETGEKLEEAATREILEEAGVKAEVLKYIGKINYTYEDTWKVKECTDKTVHWFLMKSRSLACVPQREEGFIDAKFIHIDRACEIAKYDDEKGIINKAVNEYTTKDRQDVK